LQEGELFQQIVLADHDFHRQVDLADCLGAWQKERCSSLLCKKIKETKNYNKNKDLLIGGPGPVTARLSIS